MAFLIHTLKQRKIMKKLIILLLMLSFIGCKEKQIVDPDNLLLGTWVNVSYESQNGVTLITYQRNSGLDNQNSGYIFYNSGKITDRSVVGRCGTPPLSYGDFEGNWTFDNDIVTINSTDWFKQSKTNRYSIESLDSKVLVLKLLN